MKKAVINWYDSEEMTLRQAVRNGIEFSFVSKDNRQISPFFYCKDYLQDAIQGFLINKRRAIYGYVYDPNKHPPICLNFTRLLVTNSQDSFFSEKIPNCIDFLNQIEKSLKMTPTKVIKIENPPLIYLRCGVWLFQGSRRWMKSPPMISLYTLLIRLGFGHTIGQSYIDTLNGIINLSIKPYQDVDKGRLQESIKGINKILTKGDRKIFMRKIQDNYPERITVKVMHDKLGIVGFSRGQTENYIPEWHKGEKKL